MAVAQTANSPVTIEQFMAAIEASGREFDRKLEESRRESEESWRKINEAMDRIDALQKETALQMKATDLQIKATALQMKATDKRIGELSNRFGEMVEHMIMPNLIARFDELGFFVTRATRTVIDRKNDIFMEIDALLENGDKVIAVEMKNKPTVEDINYHLERMDKLRFYVDLRNDQRTYLAAMAGVIFGESEKIYALKHGLYVIEPSEETFKITEPQGQYYPRQWQPQPA